MTRGRRLAGAPRRRPCGLPATDLGVANLIAVSSPSLVLSQPNPVRRRRGMGAFSDRKARARALAQDDFGPAHLRLWLLVDYRASTGRFNLKQNTSM